MSFIAPSRPTEYACCQPSRSLSHTNDFALLYQESGVSVGDQMSIHALSRSTSTERTAPVAAVANQSVFTFCRRLSCCTVSSVEFAAQSMRAM